MDIHESRIVLEESATAKAARKRTDLDIRLLRAKYSSMRAGSDARAGPGRGQPEVSWADLDRGPQPLAEAAAHRSLPASPLLNPDQAHPPGPLGGGAHRLRNHGGRDRGRRPHDGGRHRSPPHDRGSDADVRRGPAAVVDTPSQLLPLRLN